MNKIKSAWSWFAPRFGPVSWGDFFSGLAGAGTGVVIGMLLVYVIVK